MILRLGEQCLRYSPYRLSVQCMFNLKRVIELPISSLFKIVLVIAQDSASTGRLIRYVLNSVRTYMVSSRWCNSKM